MYRSDGAFIGAEPLPASGYISMKDGSIKFDQKIR